MNHTFHAALDGNDKWSGTLATPNENGTDGPFATLERARDAARELKRQQQGTLKQPVTVFVRGGTYFLDEPLTFTPEDSGTSECPVTFEVYNEEIPVVSGGRRITGWKQARVNGRDLWASEIPEVRAGQWVFHQLWVNGKRRARARYPSKGYLQVLDSPDATAEMRWNEGQKRFRFHKGDLKTLNKADDAEVVLMTRWVESHLPIESVDEKERIINFTAKSRYLPDAGDLYYLEHALEFLDTPGEWVLDRKTGTLYYLPVEGEDMDEGEVVAPVLEQVIRFEGDPGAERYVEHLAFRGLAFSHTEWWFSESERVGSAQAAVDVTGAVCGEGVRHCAFDGCTIAHVGSYALELSRGWQHNRITGCQISDLGAGGLKIGETCLREEKTEQTHDNEIADCHIHDGGRVFHSAVGIWIGQSYGNRIVHNHIHDFYYTGISIGWTWGYGETLARDNMVEFNHIHHIGQRSDGDGPILSDMGGIYTLGVQPGTVIRFNLFHDIAGFKYGGWGIYFDEGSTHIVAENNIVYRTTHGGFHQHYGKENIVRNNVFAFGRDAQIQRSRQEPHLSFTFERNVVYWRDSKPLAGKWDDDRFVLDRNVYWQEGGGEIRFGDLSWEEWRGRRIDEHTLIADPLFVAPEKNDFTVRPNSPVFKVGFQEISIAEVGPRRFR